MTHFFGVPYETRQHIARTLHLGVDAVPEIDLMHICHVLTMLGLGLAIGYFLGKSQ